MNGEGLGSETLAPEWKGDRPTASSRSWARDGWVGVCELASAEKWKTSHIMELDRVGVCDL